MTAGEGFYEAGDVGAVAHGERRHLQPGDPAFGARLQLGNLLRRQLEPHHLIEERCCLLGRETQVGGTQLVQFAARPQPCQRQRWIRPRGDDQVHPRWEVLDKEG